jgi:hypothetical protein
LRGGRYLRIKRAMRGFPRVINIQTFRGVALTNGYTLVLSMVERVIAFGFYQPFGVFAIS